jgi:hypothetical protein
MESSRPPLVVAFELSEKRKAIVADALVGASAVVKLRHDRLPRGALLAPATSRRSFRPQVVNSDPSG